MRVRCGAVLAAVCPVAMAQTVEVPALKAHVTEKLAKFKVQTIDEVFEEALPRNAAGKILKRELRDAHISRRG